MGFKKKQPVTVPVHDIPNLEPQGAPRPGNL